MEDDPLVLALERIADALTAWVTLEQKRYDKEYPTKVPRDATQTKLPSEEDELRASLGDTGESTEDWLTDVGPRERELDKRKK